MNTQQAKKLLKLSEDTEKFLLEYASGKYGKVEERLKVNKTTIKKFLKRATESDLKEALSYAAPSIKKEMLKELNGGDGGGASDLEDWLYHVINREDEEGLYTESW
jgi:hypothetical protein